MLTDEEHDRLKTLNRTMSERPLTNEESAELGTLMAIDLGASRDPGEPAPLRRQRERTQDRPKGKHKRRRR